MLRNCVLFLIRIVIFLRNMFVMQIFQKPQKHLVFLNQDLSLPPLSPRLLNNRYWGGGLKHRTLKIYGKMS